MPKYGQRLLAPFWHKGKVCGPAELIHEGIVMVAGVPVEIESVGNTTFTLWGVKLRYGYPAEDETPGQRVG